MPETGDRWKVRKKVFVVHFFKCAMVYGQFVGEGRICLAHDAFRSDMDSAGAEYLGGGE